MIEYITFEFVAQVKTKEMASKFLKKHFKFNIFLFEIKLSNENK
jgi:hypothetical protein